ncbi:MAG: hypothetical protein M3Y28_00860 [Armatimonadota bacterium]|nr:hypothetical protein [Armatimonadota bacterium]
MTTLIITDNFVETHLQQISSAENNDMDRVATRLLKRAILAARPRPVYDLEAIKANAAEFAAEDLALAESDVAHRAELLAQEDAA